MSQTDSKEVLGSGAGVAGAVAIESGTDLGEIEVKARGYWEQVWRRFKRDKIAIAGGITIILLLLMAFVGAPIAAEPARSRPRRPVLLGAHAPGPADRARSRRCPTR